MTIRLMTGTLAALALGLGAVAAPALTPTPTGTPTLEVSAEPNPARSGQLVTLSASRSVPGAADRWTQIAGPPVSLTDADTRLATFVAPAVDAPTSAAFRFGLLTDFESRTVEVELLPVNTVGITVPHVEGQPGLLVNTVVLLDPFGLGVSRLDHELAFPSEAAVAARQDGTPDCDPGDGATAQFAFEPAGCRDTATCTAVRAELAFAAPATSTVIAYQCRIALTDRPADSCRHDLRCGNGGATSADGEELAVSCSDGSATANWVTDDYRFELEVEPAILQVGSPATLTFTAFVNGGLLDFTLHTSWPFFDTTNIREEVLAPNRVRYEVQPLKAGRPLVQVGVSYETMGGCPGNEFFFFTSALSGAYQLTIEDPAGTRITGRVAEFPGCGGAMRGVVVQLDPGSRTTQTDLTDGSFTFEGVTPGDYSLTLPMGCNPFGCWGQRDFQVGSDDVALTLCPLSSVCVGDCDGNRRVSIDELVAGVALALEGAAAQCAALDSDGSGVVQIAELVTAVSTALNGCTGFNNVTPSPTPTKTPLPL